MPLKHPPTSRQWKLLAILKESQDGITLKALADRFGVDQRTIRRDLDTLKDADIPLQKPKEAHGRIRWSIKETPSVSTTFNFEEAAALHLGHRSLAPLTNSFLWEAAKDGLQKIRKQLGTQYVHLLDQLLEVFYESTMGWSNYSQQAEIIETLTLACEEQKETTIRYRSYAAKEEQSYTIHPYALVTQSGTLYVVGYSCKDNEVRTWKLNRLVAAERLKSKFRKPADFDTETHRRKGFGVFVFNDKPVEKVRIKVDGVMARYVQEHHWHETQQFEEQPDSSVIVQFEVVPTVELLIWILKLGRHAEVLEPETLRQEIATEIDGMQRRYKGKKRPKRSEKS
jgi:predicted DNA-binding transcriptional regulator YafY